MGAIKPPVCDLPQNHDLSLHPGDLRVTTIDERSADLGRALMKSPSCAHGWAIDVEGTPCQSC